VLLCDAQMAYYPVTNYLYIRGIRAVLHRTVLTVLYVDGGYNLHVGDGSFQGVYTRLTCTGLVRGGRGPCAISRLLMCWVSVCRPTDEMGLAVRPTLHREGWAAAGAQKRCTQLCSMIA
jgi:hypothetical protein